MLKPIMTGAAALLLATTLTAASNNAIDRKDFQVAKDVATSVDRYTQFTIFDDVSATSFMVANTDAPDRVITVPPP